MAADPSIFVSIPAYRDPECQYTIIDLFEKAAKPSRVFIGVCWQVDREEDADCFLLQPPSSYAGQVRTLFLHHSEARGPCYARARIQQELFQAEDYYFQLDSHFRMIPKWDEELIHQLGMCDSKKPILSTYPSSYTLPEDYRPGMPDAAELPKSIEPIALCAREFGPDGFLRITGKKCKTFSEPRPGLFWAAGFAFSSGQVVKEVPYDIRLEDLFFGEESSMAVRLWTSGWDFFAPTKVMGYHLWTRKHRPVFREHDSEEQRQRQAASQKRVTMQLTGGDGQSSHEPPAARSLREYEEFAGISFEKRKLSARALRGGMDPGDFMDEATATPSQSSKSPYPQGLPTNIASTIQAMLGKDTAAGAPTVLLTPLSSTPPRLLSAPTKKLRLLQPKEVEQLNSCGICIIDAFLRDRCYGPFAEEVDPSEATRLVHRGAQRVALRPAGLGGGEGVWRSQKVRGDEMTWLNVPDMAGGFLQCGVKALQRACEVMPPADAANSEELDVLLAMVAALRSELDEAGFGSRRLSCMLARYPGGGARYARHRDALPTAEKGAGRRRLTAVYYLNHGWTPEHGGCLRAHLPAAVGSSMPNARKSKEEFDTTEGTQQVYHFDVEPLEDRLVLFSSEWLEHEVLPAYAERLAITTWFY